MQVATLEGRFVRALGSVGSGLGEFVRPRGLVCAPGGLLLVSDQENLRVQVPRAGREREQVTARTILRGCLGQMVG